MNTRTKSFLATAIDFKTSFQFQTSCISYFRFSTDLWGFFNQGIAT